MADNALFAQPHIESVHRPDGTILVRSTDPLHEYTADLAVPLLRWSTERPDAALAAQWSEPDGWRALTYRDARERAELAAEALLRRGLGPDRPLVVLSGNSLNHLVLTLAGYLAGIPLVPLSVHHSTSASGHERIRDAIRIVDAGGVYAEDAQRYAAALDVAREQVPVVITGTGGAGSWSLADLLWEEPAGRLADARAAVTPDSVAKILFTSGSTGRPKAVPNTHRMLCAVQQMMRQAWPFLANTPLTLVDWLPWSHTFGGNHNLNMVLATGGTLYIDDGGPTPELFPRSLRRLAGRSPNVYFNVPAGFELLATELEGDTEFATGFFARLRLMLSAGAPLREPLRGRILAVAARVADHPVRFTSSWGLTETASAVTTAHLDIDEPAAIGVPVPGVSLKLAPVDGKWEMRVTGPTVLPGYLHADLPEAFDDEGYYRTGDAGRLVDADDPGRGLVFDGRIAEDFKLATGTWVHVSALRSALLGATDLLADAVITGHGRLSVGALAWLRPDVADTPELRAKLAADLAAFNGTTGSSRRVERLLLLAEPPSRVAGELSDKGSINQRRVLERRSDQVESLYREPAPGDVIRDRPLQTSTGGRPDHVG